MNNQRHINTLLTKSYLLCLIFALVGCIPAASSRSMLINTQAGTFTATNLPSLSVGIPETIPSNEITNGLLIRECERNCSGMFDDVLVPSKLQNSGGGGGGGRRGVAQGMS